MEQASKQDQPASARKSRNSRKNLIFAILSLTVCCVFPLFALVGSQAAFNKVSDFPEYYGAMRLLCSGQGAKIYRLKELFKAEHNYFPGLKERNIGFYIPPFSAVLLAPLGLLPPFPAYCLFMLAALIALSAGAVILGKHFKLQAEGIVWLASIVLASAATFESLKIAQLAPVLFASMSFFLFQAGRQKDIAAGICLSALLLKPQELLPISIYLAFAGRIKIVLSLSAVLVILAIISLCSIGLDGYANYFDLLKDSATNTQYMQPELCATLRGQLLRVVGLPKAMVNLLSSLALSIVLAMVSVVAYKFARKNDYEVGFLRLALPLGLLSSLHCHDYDLLLLAPWLLSLYLQKRKDSLNKLTLLILLLLLLSFSIPIYVPIHYDWLIHQHQVLNPIFVLFAAGAVLSSVQFLGNTHAERLSNSNLPAISPSSTES